MGEAENIQIPPAWEELAAGDLAGTILVLGAADSGKSTLAGWLARRLAGRGLRVGWLDGDLGQTTLGVPGCLSLALLDSPAEGGAAVFRSFFVGATSPRGHMLPLLVGLRRLHDQALAAGAATMLVDTTGLVAADAGGGALKEWKIELLRPKVVIALQRDGELEHILAPLRRQRNLALHLLEPATRVRSRSPEERAARRRRLFRNYFAVAVPVRVPLRELPVHGREKALPGRLLSFLDEEGFSVGLGLLLQLVPGAIEVLTPLADLSRVAGVRIGDLRLDAATGAEIPVSGTQSAT